MKKLFLLSISALLFCIFFFYFFSNKKKKEIDNTFITNAYTLDSALQFVGGDAMINAGLSGKGVKIGIIDVGFYRANKEKSLRVIYRENRVKNTKDFVDTLKKDFYSIVTRIDKHGTDVFKYIGGRDSILQYGLALEATFYLARTDHAIKESRKEEAFFLKALQWLDSQGVRLINVSLGYGFGYDNPSENYAPTDMNGKTTLISAAAQQYIDRHNFIIVVSAGNNGTHPWKSITAPADAQGVISVGLTDWYRNKKSFSSEGPPFLEYLKPNISCFNTLNGTSYSAPVITGIVACMLEKNQLLSSEAVISILQKSSHLYPYGNNYIGYGIPDASRILKLLEGIPLEPLAEKRVCHSQILIDCKELGNHFTLFHKKGNWTVLKEEYVESNENTFLIKKPQPIAYQSFVMDNKSKFMYHTTSQNETVQSTTVVTEKKIFEIQWN